MNTFQLNREPAMKWWNSLGEVDQKDLTLVCFYGRTPNSLTGREIESIYRSIQQINIYSEEPDPETNQYSSKMQF